MVCVVYVVSLLCPELHITIYYQVSLTCRAMLVRSINDWAMHVTMVGRAVEEVLSDYTRHIVTRSNES